MTMFNVELNTTDPFPNNIIKMKYNKDKKNIPDSNLMGNTYNNKDAKSYYFSTSGHPYTRKMQILTFEPLQLSNLTNIWQAG